MGCLESQPIVQWVRKKVGDQVNFIRLDIQSPVTREIMKKYRITLNSAYLIFDGQGKEVWRSYAIPLNGRKVVRILQELVKEAGS